ncbi:MAG TPA: hypothetical protein VGJ20_34505 [Xanthobacteraceae bacterium]
MAYFLPHDVSTIGLSSPSPDCAGAKPTLIELAAKDHIGADAAIEHTSAMRTAHKILEDQRQQLCAKTQEECNKSNAPGACMKVIDGYLTFMNPCDPHYWQEVQAIRPEVRRRFAEAAALKAKVRDRVSYDVDTITYKGSNPDNEGVVCTANIKATIQDGTAETPISYTVEKAPDGRLVVKLTGQP